MKYTLLTTVLQHWKRLAIVAEIVAWVEIYSTDGVILKHIVRAQIVINNYLVNMMFNGLKVIDLMLENSLYLIMEMEEIHYTLALILLHLRKIMELISKMRVNLLDHPTQVGVGI